MTGQIGTAAGTWVQVHITTQVHGVTGKYTNSNDLMAGSEEAVLTQLEGAERLR